MASLYNADLKPLAENVATHPYDHATKLFIADNLKLAPKQSFLYYVCININADILQNILNGIVSSSANGIGEPVNSETLIEQYEAGLMAKRVDLPKFTVSTKTLNAYNRKNIVTTHLQYDPITITFHDDCADVVTRFWNDYYTYYFRDSDYPSQTYGMPHKYGPRMYEKWGFNPRNMNLSPFLRDIQIFSLHNKRFTEYRLINPFITSWRHGEHQYAGDTSTMEHTMQVAYETVKYRTGWINPVDVNGFALLHYDNFNSPISTSTTNIYTDSGVLGALAGVSTDLSRPDGFGAGQGILSQVLGAYQFYKNVKNANYSSLAKVTLGQAGLGVLNGVVNGAATAIFPTLTGSAGYGAGTSAVAQQTAVGSFSSPYAYTAATAGATVAGTAIGRVLGSGTNYVNNQVNDWTRGVIGAPGPYAVGSSGAVRQVVATNGAIAINPQTGQPYTGTVNSVVLDDNGNIISEFTTQGTQSGGYDATNPNLNAKSVQTTYAEDGTPVIYRTYQNGDQVVLNSTTGEQISFVPGNYTSPINNPNSFNTNPQNARDLAAAGTTVPQNGQLYTDPRTGVSYVVGGSTGALIQNTITGSFGVAGGFYAASSINRLLSQTALGNTVAGQTISAAVSGVTGVVVGKAINNGMQVLLDGFSGTVNQGIDSVSKSIKNVVGSWTGDGKYDPTKPLENIVSKTPLEEGGYAIIDKTGAINYTNENGTIKSVTPGSQQSEAFYSKWFGGASGTNSDPSAATPYPGGVLTDGSGQIVTSGAGGGLTYGNDPTVQELNNGGLQESSVNTEYFGPSDTDSA